MKCRNIQQGSIIWFGRTCQIEQKAVESVDDFKSGSVYHCRVHSDEDISTEADNTGLMFSFITNLKTDIVPVEVSFDMLNSVNACLSNGPDAGLYVREEDKILYYELDGSQIDDLNFDGLLSTSTGDCSSLTKYFMYNETTGTKFDSHVKDAEAIRASLSEKLSVLKGELWNNINFGIPLFDKFKTKGTIDAYIMSLIMSHPDVNNIKTFDSNVDKTTYSLKCEVISKYGDLDISI